MSFLTDLGILEYRGTGRGDEFFIEGSFQRNTRAYLGLGGDDVFRIRDAGDLYHPVVAMGGTGNDTYKLEATTLLGSVVGAVLADGGGAADKLVIPDRRLVDLIIYEMDGRHLLIFGPGSLIILNWRTTGKIEIIEAAGRTHRFGVDLSVEFIRSLPGYRGNLPLAAMPLPPGTKYELREIIEHGIKYALDVEAMFRPRRLVGSEGDNVLAGAAGDDTLLGMGGNDRISGQDGNDSLIGGRGNDWLNGNNGDDFIYGDAGRDSLLGGSGNDYLYGGTDRDNLWGGAGDDRLAGGDGNDLLLGEAGNDGLYGGKGHDSLFGGSGLDSAFGGDGRDRLDGGAGDDVLSGEAGDDYLIGAAGRDSLIGGAGSDRLYGGDGDDRLAGGTGNDQAYGGEGADETFGGTGNDMLRGDGGSDTLFGEADDDRLYGGVGNDRLFGGDGDDLIDGGPDIAVATVDAFSYWVTSVEILFGGGGSDVFVFGPNSGSDIIIDFDPGDDRIRLTGGINSSNVETRAAQITGADYTGPGIGLVFLDEFGGYRQQVILIAAIDTATTIIFE